MSIGSPFPSSNQTFSLSNPSITQTLWNEIARAVMATQRGLGADVGNLATEWNVREQDVKGLIAERMVFDMGSFTLDGAASSSYADIATVQTETITFTSGVFAGYQAEDVRIFCPAVYQRPWSDHAVTGKAPVAMASSIGDITTTGSVAGGDIVTTGFTWKSNAKWPVSGDRPIVYWLALAGGNDGSQGVADTPTRGFDYW